MKTKIIIALFTLMFLTTSPLYAKVYKCIIGEKTIYQSELCPKSGHEAGENTSAFDGWSFGMHIPAMKQRARERQLAISPGRTTVITKFSDKIF